MKNMVAVFVLALLCVPDAFAQEASRFSLDLHANTASPPMLGVRYELADRVDVRGSLGYSQYTQEFSYETADDDRTVRWYGGEVAALYRLPRLWRLQPYVGAQLQYAYARGNRPSVLSGRTENDRFDAGGLAGVEVRIVRWLGIFGEAGAGYASGYETNSISGFDRRISRLGLTHLGLGVQVHFGRPAK